MQAIFFVCIFLVQEVYVIKIALIDTGIKAEYINTYLQNRIIECYEVREFDKYYDITPCAPADLNGHGTACVSTINRIITILYL